MGDDAKDAAEYLRKLAHERSADLTFPDATQESEWRIADLIERQAAEIERLRAGGCARDQGTTQFCAEAASAFSVVNMLRAEIADARLNSPATPTCCWNWRTLTTTAPPHDPAHEREVTMSAVDTLERRAPEVAALTHYVEAEGFAAAAAELRRVAGMMEGAGHD